MSDIQHDQRRIREDRRSRQVRRLRFKQLSAILTTSGYALLAGGGWEPLINGKPMHAFRAIALVVGVAMLAWSVYIQPFTEKPDE